MELLRGMMINLTRLQDYLNGAQAFLHSHCLHSSSLDAAQSEVRNAIEEENDPALRKNWIARRTVISHPKCAERFIYMGNGKRFAIVKGGETVAFPYPEDQYGFVCNLPPSEEIKKFEINWSDSRNWIPGRTVLSFTDRYRLFLGDGKALYFETGKVLDMITYSSYTFCFNLPPSVPSAAPAKESDKWVAGQTVVCQRDCKENLFLFLGGNNRFQINKDSPIVNGFFFDIDEYEFVCNLPH